MSRPSVAGVPSPGAGHRAIHPLHSRLLPRYTWAFVLAYFVASLAHFAHNAESIAFYPGMPAWLTAQNVYVAWIGVTSVGVVALAMFRLGFSITGALFLGLYGALGLDGLAHYTLALCSEHTVWANITIWSEAVAGVLLLIVSCVAVGRRLVPAIASHDA